MPPTRREYELHAEYCTRAAERTNEHRVCKMLPMLALQWKLAALREAVKQTTARTN